MWSFWVLANSVIPILNRNHIISYLLYTYHSLNHLLTTLTWPNARLVNPRCQHVPKLPFGKTFDFQVMGITWFWITRIIKAWTRIDCPRFLKAREIGILQDYPYSLTVISVKYVTFNRLSWPESSWSPLVPIFLLEL